MPHFIPCREYLLSTVIFDFSILAFQKNMCLITHLRVLANSHGYSFFLRCLCDVLSQVAQIIILVTDLIGILYWRIGRDTRTVGVVRPFLSKYNGSSYLIVTGQFHFILTRTITFVFFLYSFQKITTKPILPTKF